MALLLVERLLHHQEGTSPVPLYHLTLGNKVNLHSYSQRKGFLWKHLQPQLPDPAGNVGVVAADIANNNPFGFGEHGLSESSLQPLDSDKQDELRRLLHGEEVTSQLEPLLSDTQRRMELETELQRLIDNGIMRRPSPSEFKKMIDAQFECDKRLEEALRFDGISDDIIYSSRKDWRRVAFSPNSRPTPIFSNAMRVTLDKYPNIRDTLYYKRVLNEIQYK